MAELLQGTPDSARCFGLVGDLASDSEATLLVAEAVRLADGRLDIVINNAGMCVSGDVSGTLLQYHLCRPIQELLTFLTVIRVTIRYCRACHRR